MHCFTPLSPTTFLERSGLAFPNRPAIVHPTGILTYAELRHQARSLAAILRRLHVQPADRVAVLTENSHATITAHFSIPAIGAVIVMINPWLEAPVIQSLLHHAQAKVLIVDAALLDKIALNAPEALPHLHDCLVIDRQIDRQSETQHPRLLDYDISLSAVQSIPEIAALGLLELDQTVTDELAPLALNFTSGTTGTPKGVLCTHRGAYLHALGQALMMGLDRHSRYLWSLPMFHVNGWGHMWASVAVGATQVVLSPEQSQQLDLAVTVTEHQITHLCGAPTLVRRLAETAVDGRSLPGLTITTGGAAPSPTLIQQLETLGVRFIHQYGLNETYGPFVVSEEQPEWQALSPAARAEKRARQGVATLHAGTGVQVADATGQRVPADGKTLGEVIVRGNTVSPGYDQNPEMTQKVFYNGWFHTGDMAVVHGDGHLEIRDRLKDLIYVETAYGWENISSIEIENILCQHPKIQEAAVIGLAPDITAKAQTILVAFIQTGESESLSDEELQQFSRSHLAIYQQPDQFVWRILPKTATGKVLKGELAAEALKATITRMGN